MNRYRVTCLSPLLVGDGQKLAPIDYMVWKDQVNVLDQMRIFRLLSKGPRLEGYLTQIRRADRLDFASWGGYAQNFAPPHSAGKPFARHPLPARAHRGPVHPHLRHQRRRTLPARHRLEGLPAHSSVAGARPGNPLPRTRKAAGWRPAAALSGRSSGIGRSRFILERLDPGAAHRRRRSASAGGTRIYLLRTATLVSRNNRLELGWKAPVRGRSRAAARRTPCRSSPKWPRLEPSSKAAGSAPPAPPIRRCAACCG
jgi:CRISPR-associated protein Csm5